MKLKWNKSYFGIGLTAFIVIACSILFFLIINRFDVIVSGFNTVFSILMPIISGFVIAYLLNPLLNFFERTCYKKIQPQLKYSKLRRGLSVGSTFVLIILLLSGFFWLLIPQLTTSISTLIDRIPGYFESARTFLEGLFQNSGSMPEWLSIDLSQLFSGLEKALSQSLPFLNDIVEGATKSAIGLVTTLFNIFVGAIVAIYLLYSKERFAAQAKKVMFALFPRSFTLRTISVLSQTDKMFNGYIFGKVVEALSVAILCFLGCALLQLPYALLISVIMFVFNLIPYFGPLIGAIPCTLLILLVDPLQALWFVILITVLQQFDGNVIAPLILGNQTGLTSFWVIFSIFIFGGLFGFIGMLIGVPTFAVIYSLIRALVQKRLEKKGLPLSTRDYMKMEPETPEDALVIVEEKPKEIRVPKIFGHPFRRLMKNAEKPDGSEEAEETAAKAPEPADGPEPAQTSGPEEPRGGDAP